VPADGDNSTTVHARVEGRVQGVWFRGWTVDEATVRGLNGWVRNVTDGTVEALFNGPKETVDDMIEALHKGPRLANVTNVSVREVDAPGSGGAFPATGFHQTGTIDASPQWGKKA